MATTVANIRCRQSDELIKRGGNTLTCTVAHVDSTDAHFTDIYTLSCFSYANNETEVVAVRATLLINALAKWENTRWVAERICEENNDPNSEFTTDILSDVDVLAAATRLGDAADMNFGFVRVELTLVEKSVKLSKM